MSKPKCAVCEDSKKIWATSKVGDQLFLNCPACSQFEGMDLPPGIQDLINELNRQAKKYGGAPNDDLKAPFDWVQLLQDYSGWARVEASKRNADEYRKRLVQVAGLAIAAVQSHDRLNSPESES